MSEKLNALPFIAKPLAAAPPIITSLLIIIGGIVLTAWLFSVARLIASLFILSGKKVQSALLSPFPQLTYNLQLSSFGSPSKTWAVISGASDGLGREYSLQLARAGFNVLLLSRTESKLSALATDITKKYNTKTSIFAIDFADTANTKAWDALKSHIEATTGNGRGGGGGVVSILINNVGVSHSIPVPFALTPPQEIENIINVNCLSTLRLTQLLLPGMLAQKNGLILTMGSFAGTLPTPLLATYSGSKAFLQQWSSALSAEVADQGVTVHLVQSYLVATAMSKIRRTSAMVPGPREYVRSVLGKVGRTGGAQGWSASGTPWWTHAVMEWGIVKTVGVGSGVALWINKRMHEGIRERALRKMRREKEAGKKGQ
ncbi:uncharacterized protein KY384_003320 [Bacidia gigantensis]|uniref:uncharacterized protein n=1 Tax=Bacidia gigantensis TaxID=2732470 RepID=UPI001D05B7EA|nr:uncharacterized protein KY384_003320 [Bacidia gigantensis]KAG8531688.1 hypothetical protein KY384_003320 [Bacidia gigantensis]